MTVGGAVGQASGGDAGARVAARTFGGASDALRAVRVGAGAVATLGGVGGVRVVVVGARGGVGGRVEPIKGTPGRGVVVREVARLAVAGMVHHHVVTRQWLRPRTHRDRQGQFRFGCAKTAPGFAVLWYDFESKRGNDLFFFYDAQTGFCTDDLQSDEIIIWIQNAPKYEMKSTQWNFHCVEIPLISDEHV